MLNFIKKNWFVIFIVIALLFAFGWVSNCRDTEAKKLLDGIAKDNNDLKSQLVTAREEKNKIYQKYLDEKNKPPTTIEVIKTKIKTIKVKDEDYVDLKSYEDAVLLAEFWQKEHDKVVSAFENYVKTDNESDQKIYELIYTQANKINMLKLLQNERRRAISFGVYVGYGYNPHLNEFDWSIGLGIQYEINLFKLIKKIF